MLEALAGGGVSPRFRFLERVVWRRGERRGACETLSQAHRCRLECYTANAAWVVSVKQLSRNIGGACVKPLMRLGSICATSRPRYRRSCSSGLSMRYRSRSRPRSEVPLCPWMPERRRRRQTGVVRGSPSFFSLPLRRSWVICLDSNLNAN